MAIQVSNIFENLLQSSTDIGLSWLESKALGSSSKTSSTQPPPIVTSQEKSFDFSKYLPFVLIGFMAFLFFKK